ncbi:MAG: ribosome biogenesis GTPase YlqF [Christensenellales bacterium]|jgi:ribosome biogenesis GTPase A
MTTVINWYPGHMAKAKRQIMESIEKVDVVAEILDARIPLSSRNADFDVMFAPKARLIVLNKADLADESVTQGWVDHYKQQGFVCFSFCSVTGGNKQALFGIQEAAKGIVEKYKAKGVHKTVRVLIAGIPNVGKSAFINTLGKSARAKTGNKPGVTRGQQWVKISPYLELLDTPGILWPKLENQMFARRLAYTGSIRDEVLPPEKLCERLIGELIERYPNAIKTAYGVTNLDDDAYKVMQEICYKRHFIQQGGETDMRRCAEVVLHEYRAGKLGRMTLDRLNDLSTPTEAGE